MFGCEAQLSRKRSVVRDESLRAALAAAAPTPQHQWVWVRGDCSTEVGSASRNGVHLEIRLALPNDAHQEQLKAMTDDDDEEEGDSSQFSKELRVGDSVEGQYGTDKSELWWPGTITRVWRSGDVDVRYDDGDVELQKLRSRVRLLQDDVSVRLSLRVGEGGGVRAELLRPGAKRTAKQAVAQARAEGLKLKQSTSASGYKGVKAASWNSSRYEARVRGVDGRVHLGNFATAEEAALAVARAEARAEAREEARAEAKQATEDMEHEDELTVECEQLEPVTWAQCETCDKWRKLPHLAEDQVPDDWYCHMNLDSLHNACDLPEELEDDVSLRKKPAVKIRALSRRAAGLNRTSHFHSPCVHCGVPLHHFRKECTCGRPNRWYVHRGRVVRLSLSVEDGGSVRAALLRASSDATDSVSNSAVVRLSLKVGEGGSVRAEVLPKSSEQENHTAEGPVLRKRKHVSQGEPTAADDLDAKRKRGSSAASSSALAVAHEEDDDTEFNSSELEKEAPGWHDACTWVQCDRCQKWRRWLHSNDELPDKWWCQLNDDVRNDPRTRITKVLVGATATYEVHLDSTLIAGEIRRLRGPRRGGRCWRVF